MIFQYEELQRFLRYVSKRSPVFPLSQWNGQAGVILRHDVDLDVLPALRMAEVERACEVAGSYFFLMTSPHYNPLSAKNRGMLREMIGMGCEIGLHFDPTVYPTADAGALARHVDEEASMLACAVGATIRSVSLHNPSISGNYTLFANYHNAYDPAIFDPDCYMSDSRRRFRHDPYEFVLRAETRTIQVLLHPEHYSKDGAGYVVTFRRYLERVEREVDATFSVNETYVSEKAAL